MQVMSIFWGEKLFAEGDPVKDINVVTVICNDEKGRQKDDCPKVAVS